MDKQDWQLLWRLPSPTDPDKYVFLSLEDGPERWAFVLADDAPLAITARTYYETLKKLEAMTRPAFDAFVAQWAPQQARLFERDPNRAEGFFAAIREVEERIAVHEAQQLAHDVAYLFAEKEAPHE